MIAKRPGHGADAALLDRMVRAVVDEVDPDRVILFGSRAGGDAPASFFLPARFAGSSSAGDRIDRFQSSRR